MYGFYNECKLKFNINVWNMFTNCFDCLPLAGIINKKIFCIHAGLSPEYNILIFYSLFSKIITKFNFHIRLRSLDDIKNIQRPIKVPESGLLNDLLWSDPNSKITHWTDNSRGFSYTYGKSIVNDFLEKNDFDLMCRGHEAVEDGYEFLFGIYFISILVIILMFIFLLRS